MAIYVGNLAYEATIADLNNIFSEHGSIKQINIPPDRQTGRSRGFAFVEMATDDEEQVAIAALNGVEFKDRDLRVNKARPKKSVSGVSRSDISSWNSQS
jgi:RNA recognition motif-containing protein